MGGLTNERGWSTFLRDRQTFVKGELIIYAKVSSAGNIYEKKLKIYKM